MIISHQEGKIDVIIYLSQKDLDLLNADEDVESTLEDIIHVIIRKRVNYYADLMKKREGETNAKTP